MIARLVNVALGVWLMFAPAALGYAGSSAIAEATDRIVGPLVVSVAIVAIWPEMRPLRWVNAGFGVLLMVVPPLVGLIGDWPAVGVVSSVATGVAVLLCARVRGEVDAEFGGGWRSVWRDDLDTVTSDPYGSP